MTRNWARKILSKFNSAKKDKNKPTAIPVSEREPIAARRKFTFTPSSSSTTLADPAATIDSPFFRLPAELQLQILQLALGNRIIHLELTQDESHRLLGYVCHRSDPAYGDIGPRDIIDDPCFWDRRLYTDGYDIQHDPRQATVGALGWLMSCKKAYAVGIDILYSSNTFCLENKDTILHLNNFILPQRSRAITKTEMIWRLPGFITDDGVLPVLTQYLNMPSRVLPNIQDLYISFNCQVFDTIDVDTFKPATATLVEEMFLPRLDEMVRELPPSAKEVNIAIPANSFSVITGKANRAGATFDESSPRFDFRLWRPLPPAQWNDGTSAPGYWLHRSGYVSSDLIVCRYPA